MGAETATLHRAAWLFDGARLHRDHALCVSGGRVLDMGPADALVAKYPHIRMESGAESLLVPAFINAHDHGRALSPVAYGVADRCLELWIPELSRSAAIPPYDAAYYDGLLLASAGVGTVLHSHNPLDWANMEDELADTARGYNDAGLRVSLCPPYVDQNNLIYHGRGGFRAALPGELRAEFDRMVCDNPLPLEDYLALVDRLRERLRPQLQAGMADIQLHPAGGQWCGDEALLRLRDYARDNGCLLHLHLLETRYQREYAFRRWGKGFVRHLADIGLLGPWLSCAHMVWLEEGDAALLAETGTRVVVNPSSNLRLNSGVAPLRRLLDSGVTCALGLDGCGLDDDQDYVRELRLAALNPGMPGVRGGLRPVEILRMATAAGAAVTGGRLSPGRLEPGGAADFVRFDCGRLRTPYADPSLDPLALLLARGTRRAVDGVYVGGRCIAAGGEPQPDDLERAAGRLREAVARGGARPPANPAILEAIGQFYAQWEAEV